MKRKPIYRKLLNKYGNILQIIVAIEELSELQKELTKFLRGTLLFKEQGFENISEELADVEIMLKQLKLIFNNEDSVKSFKRIKLERILKRELGNADNA